MRITSDLTILEQIDIDGLPVEKWREHALGYQQLFLTMDAVNDDHVARLARKIDALKAARDEARLEVAKRVDDGGDAQLLMGYQLGLSAALVLLRCSGDA
jgi:hypothetical protein